MCRSPLETQRDFFFTSLGQERVGVQCGTVSQDTLNGVIAILFIILVGFLAVFFRAMKREYIKELNLYVFKFALPALVIRGLGLKIDLYQSGIWQVIGAFVLLRTFTLIGSIAVTVISRGGPGDVVAHWMASTWISSIILGVPILIATLGPSQAQLGLLAAISSFIFQLPAPRGASKEVGKGAELPYATGGGSIPQEVKQPVTVLAAEPNLSHGDTGHGGLQGHGGPPSPDHLAVTLPNQDRPSSPPAARSEDAPVPNEARHAATASRRDGGHGIDWRHHGFSWRLRKGYQAHEPGWWVKEGLTLGGRLFRNHVLWGIFIGFVLSLSTLGRKYLDPGTLPSMPNKTAVRGLAWLDEGLNSLGQCTTPVALFTTGMWLCSWQALGNKRDLLQAVLYILAKFVAVPGLMVGCCFLCGLHGATARGAVLLAALPIADAAFAIMQEFGVKTNVMAQQVTLQTILLLPVLLGWLGFMDAVGLFPVPPPLSTPRQ
eukprot:jgi/Botrbrau1/9420/Bobra.0252s0044.1